MSNLLKVGAASLNQTPLDWERNRENIIEALNQAKEQGVGILCLPEMSITGYGCEDHFISMHIIQKAYDIMLDLVEETEDIFTCFGIPYQWGNALYNVMVCVYNREIVGIVPKQHLAGDGLHYEPRWFKPWPAGLIQQVNDINIGDIVLAIDGVLIGFEICEDAFVAERPGNGLARRSVDIILNPSASHFSFGKSQVRERIVVDGSRAFNATYIYANLLGNEAGRAIYDGDCIIASCGDLLARGPLLNFTKVNLTTAVIDFNKVVTKALGTASFSPDIKKYSDSMVEVLGTEILDVELPRCPNDKITKPIISKQDGKYDEFTKTITLGLFDYLEKSHSKGFVISLSGGADSAACAILVDQMLKRAIDELGFNETLNRLCFDFFLKTDSFYDEVINKLLTCIYQSTNNSSKTTLEAASGLANQIGAKFAEINVEDIVQQYIKLAESIEGRSLTWEHDDLALQNIQARARAPSAWMIANLEGKLLITTSNRSEAAVGYCTMDGDTAGSIAPIGGIDKAFLLDWLSYMFHYSLGRYSSLEKVINQKPTAELRPDQTQTDEDDLMPYAILDAIETLAILEKKGPAEVFEWLCRELELTTEKAFEYTNKFFTMWCRNQWKRTKFSASMHCDNHNLDPETWCRFPILSGGFTKELEDLKS
jgi:NAD+ synthase (glutamine-hydrolysing)